MASSQVILRLIVSIILCICLSHFLLFFGTYLPMMQQIIQRHGETSSNDAMKGRDNSCFNQRKIVYLKTQKVRKLHIFCFLCFSFYLVYPYSKFNKSDNASNEYWYFHLFPLHLCPFGSLFGSMNSHKG